MVVHKDVIREVERSPSGPQIAAIFDFDGTLIAGFSATEFIKQQWRRGDINREQMVELLGTVTSFSLGRTGFSGLMLTGARFMRGVSEQEYQEFGQQVYEQQIARLIYPESRALVLAHQRKGHTVAVISSATPYQVEPAARDLDVEHVMCSRYEVENGEFTGGIERPLCFGQGKVLAAEQLAETHGVDLDKSYFYSDSDDDIELLERVGNPRPLNPNARLTSIAERRGWPTRRFRSRGRPRTGDLLRSVAATGIMIPCAALSLPIWALTGSKREAQNFSSSLFADSASALIGLELNVNGERYLWQQRPAVFVFNHQSKADMVIVAKLIRRDIAGVGKKEISNMPVLGKLMEFAGTVLIDRANSSSAIEAMAPLVDVMRQDGKSVVMSPEGTRTITPKLAPFKKGAFHLAMQAGVPMVPIVIHNAIDVAPKGDFVFRSGLVDVEVLPPVDTRNWSVATIDKHVADVRGMFLEALGQGEAPAEESAGDSIEGKETGKSPDAVRRQRKTAVAPKTRRSAKKKSAAKKKPAAAKARSKTKTSTE